MSKLKDYFFECITTNETYQTNNRSLAFEKFNACQFPCELTYKGEFLAAKEFEEDEITGEFRLVDELVIDETEEYVEL